MACLCVMGFCNGNVEKLNQGFSQFGNFFVIVAIKQVLDHRAWKEKSVEQATPPPGGAPH
ncbi:MAG: hypothetical protein DHS20C12_01940 [Pseudohongiella sp.]|nr:MAG: hypothetical protein DHS20C12_01940 [Pseudohongiella sp.]